MRDARPFRQRLRSREPLIGTFVKIPHPQVVEILAGTALDFIVLDAEHAAFDIATIDRCLMAAKLSGLPALVRVASLAPATIGAVLDMGAAGVVIPHIASARDADAAVSASLYIGGERGMSGATRAGGYARSDLAAYAGEADETTVIVAQIEDAEAIGAINDIVAQDRIDCFFIGRADLMVSLGEDSLTSPAVEAAVATLSAAILDRDRVLGTFLGSAAQIAPHVEKGYSLLGVSADLSLLRAGAEALVSSART